MSFQYDWLNRLTNMVDAVGTTRYLYTAGNQLQREIAPFGFNTLLLTYTNRLRNVLRLQQPQVFWTNGYYYDAAARLTNITSQAGSFTYTVGAASPGSRLVQKLLLPNTSYITNTFDNVARLTGTYLDNSANSVLDSAIYVYNRANQRTAFTNAAGTYVQYAYDNIGQLTVATSSASSESRGYAYDAAWNLQYLTNFITYTLVCDNRNEMTTDPSSGNDTYDPNGNLTYRPGIGQWYGYDNENRLTGVTNGNYWSTGFAYDGLGKLRTRTEYTWNGSSWVVSTVTEYLYDGTRVIQERDINNNPPVSYTRGPDLSGTMQGAGGIGGLLARTSGYSLGTWSTNYFYHADGNGNITYLVDSNQTQAASYRYDAFGNTLSSSGSMAAVNVYRFSSKEIHVNSRMYIYLYRFYDPGMQRWINRDLLEEGGGINLYEFCYNSPQDYADPDGDQMQTTAPIGIGIGTGTGTLVGILGGPIGIGLGGGAVLIGGVYWFDHNFPVGTLAPPEGGSIVNAPPDIFKCDTKGWQHESPNKDKTKRRGDHKNRPDGKRDRDPLPKPQPPPEPKRPPYTPDPKGGPHLGPPKDGVPKENLPPSMYE